MQSKTKLITAQLVQVSPELFAEALDYLTMTKGVRSVTFQVVDGLAVRIDTEQQEPMRVPVPLPALTHSPPLPSKRGIHVVPKGRGVTLKTLTHKFVMESFGPDDQISAKEFGDKIGVKREDTSLRGKISRLLTELRQDGKLVVTANRQGNYSLAGGVPTGGTIMSLDDITPERVLAILTEYGPLPTKVVSDKLGIAGRDGSKRSKVTKRIRELLDGEKIVVEPGKTVGTLAHKIYKVSTG